MENINWNALRDRAYKNACDHGFHEEKLSRETYFMLIITEISEAVEADRKGKKCDPIDFDHTLKGLNEPYFDKLFEAYIKDTIHDEFADIIIRCLDLAGNYNLDLDEDYIPHQYNNSYFEYQNFADGAFELCKKVIGMRNDDMSSLNLSIIDIIYFVIDWANSLKIDIVKHVVLKMKYNETRPYKNGKKY